MRARQRKTPTVLFQKKRLLSSLADFYDAIDRNVGELFPVTLADLDDSLATALADWAVLRDSLKPRPLLLTPPDKRRRKG